MKNETAQLLEKIAEKLGTTTEYLWAILIKQAYIDAMTTLFQFVGIVVVSVLLYRLHKRLEATEQYDDSEVKGILMLGSTAVMGLVILVAFFQIPSVINGFFHPEYWALEEVLNSIR